MVTVKASGGGSDPFTSHNLYSPRSGPRTGVALDHLGSSDAGRSRVATGFAQGAALAQQVPALVERDFQLFEAPPVGVAPLAGRLTLPELVLLGDELLDLSMDLGVVHLSS